MKNKLMRIVGSRLRLRLRDLAWLAFAFMLASPPLSAATPLLLPVQQGQAAQTHFTTEAAARRHCPGGVVVWVNLNSGIYHYKGQRWYGNTKNGSFECQTDADAEGDRPTHNGQ